MCSAVPGWRCCPKALENQVRFRDFWKRLQQGPGSAFFLDSIHCWPLFIPGKTAPHRKLSASSLRLRVKQGPRFILSRCPHAARPFPIWVGADSNGKCDNGGFFGTSILPSSILGACVCIQTWQFFRPLKGTNARLDNTDVIFLYVSLICWSEVAFPKMEKKWFMQPGAKRWIS